MQSLLYNFWYGKITLWKSYWIVGELFNALIVLLIFNVEINYFKNINISNQLPFLNFDSFHFFNTKFATLSDRGRKSLPKRPVLSQITTKNFSSTQI